MSNKAQCWVISGPTAVGKGTLVTKLKELYPDIFVSVSATTRAPRSGEVDGVSYYFITDAEFDRLVESGKMLEWACVHGMAKYGTPREPVDKALSEGKTVILEIDIQGALQVRRTMSTAKQIFIMPPNWDTLVSRLAGRNTDTPDQQRKRLKTARIELKFAKDADFQIINDELGEALQDLIGLIGLSPK